ncbi:YraN family protein [Oceanicella sp. SM1341]|uniref:YraN family protein n=1 Tax=Oceanicella sp. SM1341 TaxID=1548889 RepID=UPI000E4BCEF6|nr:YraN family protein [Oceanicella sp. SM1341]
MLDMMPYEAPSLPMPHPVPGARPAWPRPARRRGLAARETGFAAEEIAERLYDRRQARVLARRWTCREGELDLVCRDGDELVFVEVRQRRSHAEAAGSVTRAKWRRLERAAFRYMISENIGIDALMRFDLVLLDQAGVPELIENAGQDREQ